MLAPVRLPSAASPPPLGVSLYAALAPPLLSPSAALVQVLHDLLSPADEPGAKLAIVDDSKQGKGVHCAGLLTHEVNTPEDVLRILRAAQDRRKIGEVRGEGRSGAGKEWTEKKPVGEGRAGGEWAGDEWAGDEWAGGILLP